MADANSGDRLEVNDLFGEGNPKVFFDWLHSVCVCIITILLKPRQAQVHQGCTVGTIQSVSYNAETYQKDLNTKKRLKSYTPIRQSMKEKGT